ncbi:MAG: DUF5683 domain-containing protein [Paludibacteraceae bacterium]|nr:DUF5683 domain-containing protein [Paludibacteraceae bacterium]
MRHWITILLLCLPIFGKALTQDSLETLSRVDTIAISTDSMAKADYRYYINLQKKPDALRAVWLGALVPGLGQIYNQSYWKLPIVYGGFMGCAYAIIWNNGKYVDYKQAYKDICLDEELSDDPNRSYNAILPEGYDINRMGGRSNYTSTLKSQQNTYRRYRDISIVAAVVLYALTLIDAYVDAQLFDFDVSPDLSLSLEPQIYQDLHNQSSAELKLAIQF